VGLLHQGGETLVGLSIEGFDQGRWCDLGLQIAPDGREYPDIVFWHYVNDIQGGVQGARQGKSIGGGWS
jgi:hypothetical protein